MPPPNFDQGFELFEFGLLGFELEFEFASEFELLLELFGFDVDWSFDELEELLLPPGEVAAPAPLLTSLEELFVLLFRVPLVPELFVGTVLLVPELLLGTVLIVPELPMVFDWLS